MTATYMYCEHVVLRPVHASKGKKIAERLRNGLETQERDKKRMNWSPIHVLL